MTQVMATPFSRTMRSLRSDSFRASLVGLFLGMLVLVLWLAWFFLARITVYETSQLATVSQAGETTADFPVTALGRILPGQSALVRLGGGANGVPQTAPAIVMDVEDDTAGGRVRVELYILEMPSDLVAGKAISNAQVDVEVEHVSPAVLVMRASGQFLNSPGLSLSPQDNQNTQLRQ
jgi:hypothetical protein